jgi:hypothetical protein
MSTPGLSRGAARNLTHWVDSVDMYNQTDTGKVALPARLHTYVTPHGLVQVPTPPDLTAERTTRPPVTGITLTNADMEMWRVRNLPHLYDDWYVDHMNDLREASVPDDMCDWDCGWCKRSVITRHLDDMCPSCGKRS